MPPQWVHAPPMGNPGSATDNGIVAACLIEVDPGFSIGENPNPRWGGADLRHRRILAKMYVNKNERMGSDLPQFWYPYLFMP